MMHPKAALIVALGILLGTAFLPGQMLALSSSRWEFQKPKDDAAGDSRGFAVIQNRNRFVILSIGWNTDEQTYIIALHSQNLIDRSRDIRFIIDGREPIAFKGSRDWLEREFSIHNHGKSAIIGSPYSSNAESLEQRKQDLIEQLQAGQTVVIRYEEIVYGSRRVRFTLRDSRKTISRLTEEAEE